METIREISQSSPVAKEVFGVLSERQRYRRRTDLNRLYNMLKMSGSTVSPDDFLNVFKTLQAAQVGSLVIGRKNNPNRFVWNYNLKDIAKAAQNGATIQQLQPLPAKRGRPFQNTVLSRSVEPLEVVKRGPGRPRKDLVPMPVNKVIASEPATVKQVGFLMHIKINPDADAQDVKDFLMLAKKIAKV